jgi:flagellar motor switch protein FliN/FliY
MADILSQDEIDALLRNDMDQKSDNDYDEGLEPYEKDALGEIGNICMGTAATTLSYLLGKKVSITTPTVSVTTWESLLHSFDGLHVGIRIEYTNGLEGSNILLLKEHDVKVIADLMLGGDGSKTDGEIQDLHLSAISEAMNQMVGSSSTSMSDMFNKKIEISPPMPFLAKADMKDIVEGFINGALVKVSFKMTIGELVDSEIMQIMPIGFAKLLVRRLMDGGDVTEQPASETRNTMDSRDTMGTLDNGKADEGGYDIKESTQRSDSFMEDNRYNDIYDERHNVRKDPVSVQPARFKSLDDDLITIERKNINLIMDVPLEVTVELGRTQKLIRDVLELSPGSVIELEKLAGEPVDILVNGKRIAKGEVVVIDENFAVRITDIVHPSKRL